MIAILRSPLAWSVALGAVAVLAIFGFGALRYQAGMEDGRAEVRAEWTTAALKAEEDKRAAERALADHAAAVELTAQSEIEAAKTAAQEAINAYAAELAKRPDARCALSDDDVRRLRGIQSRRPAASGN